MEYERLFASVAVVAVSVFAIMSLLSFYNDSYNLTLGSSFNNTLNSVEIINNITSMTDEQAAATQNIEGSGSSDSQTNLVERSLRIIVILPRLLGLIPDIMREGALVLGVPEAYVNVAVGVFVFSFVLLLAYILLNGVRR